MNKFLPVFFLVVSSSLHAQVYKTIDENGSTVYSTAQSKGAKKVDLPYDNSIPSHTYPKSNGSSASKVPGKSPADLIPPPPIPQNTLPPPPPGVDLGLQERKQRVDEMQKMLDSEKLKIKDQEKISTN